MSLFERIIFLSENLSDDSDSRVTSYKDKNHPMYGIEKEGPNYKIKHKDKIYNLTKRGTWPTHWWNLKTDYGDNAGGFTVQAEKDKTPVIKHSTIYSNHRGSGLGNKVYSALSHHYGKLLSDTDSTSEKAQRLYRSKEKQGWARQTDLLNQAGQKRWSLGPININKNISKLKVLKGKVD